MVWKDGLATNLTDGTKSAGVYSVYVSGGDVYAAGYVDSGTGWVATVWKNGSATYLTDGVNDAYAYSVFVR